MRQSEKQGYPHRIKAGSSPKAMQSCSGAWHIKNTIK